MHHFAAVDKTTNKVINKIVAVRGTHNPDQGNITFIPLKDGYTVDIGHDWDEGQRWVEEITEVTHVEVYLEQTDPEETAAWLRAHGMLDARTSGAASVSDDPD
jgi:hypothetical protein